MARTIGFGKREREMLSNDRLPADVRIAIAEFKNQIKRNQGLRVYENRDGGLPNVAAGQTYFEWQIGAAHAGRAQHPSPSTPPGVPVPYPNFGASRPDPSRPQHPPSLVPPVPPVPLAGIGPVMPVPGTSGATGDPSPRGKRRLVALVDAGRNIVRLYFTDSHYTLGEWKQLQYP